MKRTLLGIATVAGIACSLSAFGGGPPPAIKTQNVITGIYYPTNVVHAPGDKCRLFYTEKRGRIMVVDVSSGTGVPIGTFLDIDSLVGGGTTQNTEQGLLGLAFHPDYWDNGYFFVNYTNTSGNTVIARYQVSGDPNVATPSSALILMTVTQPAGNHNGGWIDFGPDGYLYIALGDGGNANDPPGNGQNINTKLGKMLRIAPNVAGSSPAYTNPSDNPFFGATAGDDSIWSYGLRNPWRCSFDRLTGDLYIGDVGQDAREEISFQQAGTAGGLNYGWRCMEGFNCTGLSGCTCNGPTLTLPIRAYSHGAGTSNGGCVTGGFMYRGCAIPDLQGFYFHSDYQVNNTWVMRYTPGGGVTDLTNINGQITPSLQGTSVSTIVSYGEDPDGELYIIKHGTTTTTGGIFKIVPPTGAAPCGLPGDFNLDGVVDGDDLGTLLGEWGGIGADLNCDFVTDGNDLGTLLGNWTP